VVRVGVVGRNVAGGVGAGGAIEGGAGLGGGADIVDANRRVVGAVDGDGQHRYVGQGAVAHRVVEAVSDRAADVERLHRRVAVVHHIGVGPVGIERQRAMRTGQRRADRARGARALSRPGPDRRHRQRGGGIVDVGVVGQNVAGGVGAGGAIGGAAGFGGGADIVDANRRVVGAVDGDGQHRYVGQGAVAHRVVEAVSDRAADVER